MDNCSTSKHWGLHFVLASLPLAVRAIQCVKSYSDVARANGDQQSVRFDPFSSRTFSSLMVIPQSKKPFVVRYRDLINVGVFSILKLRSRTHMSDQAGKYSTSIVYYAFYYNWRHHSK